ncbi:TetR/AcrR family transcriptional regulator [Glaciibacter flavus]|uniref:TetR/AcrR family transcriptional regulator n=1 Tax=Orlajensenia flava TaxID=2565934 RepID=A0A4S4FTQ3_9MICO|nr:TetR/AcrR family transcriptional regulator [Glaciibacter flavus]THG34159.1 TetR/AcrR family transcriptional regulator [Glaciibacter flavus]
MTSTSLRRRDAEENAVALLDAAAELLVVDPDASLETIASRAGLSRRAVYGHYANRDELIAATIERGAARLTSLAAPAPSDAPPVALATLGARLWGAVEQVRMVASFALRGPHAHRVAAALQPVRDRLAAILSAGVSDGSLRSDIPIATLAHLVERAAIDVLEEAAETGLSREDGHRLVMLMTLGAAGLSATDAGTLIAATASLRHPAPTEVRS